MKKRFSIFKISLILIMFIIIFNIIYLTLFNGKIKQNPRNNDITEINKTLVTKQNIPDYIVSEGEIISKSIIDIKSQIDGIITSKDFTEGQYIKKNSILFKIKNTKEKSDVSSTKTIFEQAKKDVERYKNLVDKSVSKEILDQKLEALKIAKENYTKAKYELSLTIIKSPISGYITNSNFEKGDFINSGELLVSIYDLSNLEVSFKVPEKYYNNINLQEKIFLNSPFIKDKNIIAQINYIAPNVDNLTLSFIVKAKIINNKLKSLKPGMRLFVTTKINILENALTIPKSAVFTNSGGYIVYLIESNKNQTNLKSKDIKVLSFYENLAVISGIKENTLIANNLNNANLFDGQKVKVLAS